MTAPDSATGGTGATDELDQRCRCGHRRNVHSDVGAHPCMAGFGFGLSNRCGCGAFVPLGTVIADAARLLTDAEIKAVKTAVEFVHAYNDWALSDDEDELAWSKRLGNAVAAVIEIGTLDTLLARLAGAGEEPS